VRQGKLAGNQKKKKKKKRVRENTHRPQDSEYVPDSAHIDDELNDL
jgi:hypothetical protein